MLATTQRSAEFQKEVSRKDGKIESTSLGRSNSNTGLDQEFQTVGANSFNFPIM